MEYAFQIQELIKTYPDFQLGPVNLSLKKGMVLGFIGPNGAGKTTTLRAMTGLIKKDSGKILINGVENNPENTLWKKNIGFVGENHSYYERWTVSQNLHFFSRFYPKWSQSKEIDLCRRFQLNRDKKVKNLSKGNRIKLALVKALSSSPDLLLLDEPTSGLDPIVRSEVLHVLFEVLEDSERSIFYSTHILSDINRLADELVFIKNGKLILKEYKDNLINQWRKITFTASQPIITLPAAETLESEHNRFLALSSDYEKTIAEIRKQGGENIDILRISIDEIAIQILKGE